MADKELGWPAELLYLLLILYLSFAFCGALLVFRPSSIAMSLNLLRLLIIDLGKVGSCAVLRSQQLVELGLNSLRIAMLGALNEKRHAKRNERDSAVKVERLPIEGYP
jgi:hypothetical protein